MKEESSFLEELKIGTKDLEWLSKNFSDLKKKYPKKFVAIKNQKVVVASSELDTLIKLIKKKYDNPNDYLIDFIPDDKYILVV